MKAERTEMRQWAEAERTEIRQWMKADGRGRSYETKGRFFA